MWPCDLTIATKTAKPLVFSGFHKWICNSGQESFDHTGTKLNRPGDVDNCVNLDGDEHLVNCDLINDHCVSNTITDWRIEGDQQYRLIRACAQRHNGEDNSCLQGKIPVDLDF